MMMTTPLSQSARYICRACRSQYQTKSCQWYLRTTGQELGLRNRLPAGSVQTRALATRSIPTTKRFNKSAASLEDKQSKPAPIDQHHAESTLSRPDTNTGATGIIKSSQRLRNEVNALAASDEIPDRTKVLEILEQAYETANLLIFGQTLSPEEAAEEAQEKNEDIPLLSDLEEETQAIRISSASKQDGLPIRSKEKASSEVCKSIYNLLKDPKVVLEEDILSIYVRTICQLGHPEFLPEIFFLYANKPLPLPNTKPTQFKTSSPSAAKNAVPQQLSDVALDTAILQRDLPLAIAIIDTTVATPAFRRNKFLRKGSIPLAAVGSTPLVAWAGAEWLAQWQDTFDPAMSKYMTMMGAMAYIGTLGTVGFIALTTWNDHHDRVVWTPGTPLRQRWSREEERLYFDRLAVAWGFQKKQRRGEEMGEEWEALREILGERSMILDKTDLLEGMQ